MGNSSEFGGKNTALKTIQKVALLSPGECDTHLIESNFVSLAFVT